MNSQLVGFVGVGRMGGHMASRLLDAGYALSVFDTNADVVKPLASRGAATSRSSGWPGCISDGLPGSKPSRRGRSSASFHLCSS